MAQRLRDTLRGQDMVGRWGGEEFLLLLPDTDMEGARIVSEKLREAVALQPFSVDGGNEKDGLALPVTLSLGVAVQQQGESAAETIRLADDALYEAKHCGRNCTMLFCRSDSVQTQTPQ